MDLKELFNLRDLNLWLLASGIGLDAILTIFSFILLLGFIQTGGTISIIQVVMLAVLFVVNFATAWVVSKMASDMRGPTYGVISSMSSAIITLVVLVPSGGIFGLMAAFVALAGGLNGGVMTLPKRPKSG